MALFVLFLGSWIPDIDWLIHSHRNPLTHSFLPFLIFWLLIKKRYVGNDDWNKRLLIVFGYGLGSHLITDIISGGNVVSIPPEYEIPFLLVNGVITLFISYRILKKYLK